jgi:hypothetical protein
MENPNTWGIVKTIIMDAIAQQRIQDDAGICGDSVASVIYRDLRQWGLVCEDVRNGIVRNLFNRAVLVENGHPTRSTDLAPRD